MHNTVYAETPLTKLSKSLWPVQQRPGYKRLQLYRAEPRGSSPNRLLSCAVVRLLTLH